MPAVVSYKVDFRSIKKIKRMMDSVSPKQNKAINQNALKKAAYLVQKISTEEWIVRGRGTKAKPLPDKLSNRTSTLIRSIGVDFSDVGKGSASVGTNLIYGAAHEKPSNKSKRRARPFLKPALEQASPRFDDIYAAELERQLNLA